MSTAGPPLLLTIGFTIAGALILLAIPALVVVSRRNRRAAPTMTMRFAVGTDESHLVEVDYTQPAARLVVRIDGREVESVNFSTGFRLTRSWEQTIGVRERHVLRIAKARLRAYGGLRPQTFTAFVDDVPIAHGGSSMPPGSWFGGPPRRSPPR